MPGYDVEGVTFQQPKLQEKYTCPQCKCLLLDAVQPSCGHWLCQSCAEVIIQENSDPRCPRKNCGEPFTTEDDEEDAKLYFPDRFVRKDVLSLSISCKSKREGCVWEGKIKGLRDHLMKCSFSSAQCNLCHQRMRYSELEQHQLVCPQAAKRCPLSVFGCESSLPLTAMELDEHFDLNKRQHMELVAEKLCDLEIKLKAVGVGGGMVVEPRPNGKCDSGFDSLDHSSLDVVEKDCATTLTPPTTTNTTTSNSTTTLKKSDFPRLHVSDPHSSASLSASQIAGRKFMTILEEEVAKIRSDVKNSLMRELKIKDDEIASLRTMVNKLERTQRSKNADFEDRDFRLSLIENSNYDGSMVWKIPQFSQRMSDAKSGKYTSIFSLPFYTGRYGYKMCLRLYILGDGIGKGSYMSLFFVLMKGEFDNILKWPFQHKVTFKLLNQGTGRDVTDTFQPDPMSTSFRKPRSDMNIASGCPRFVSHDDLKSNGFIEDDTIFIKCMVDTSTIRHP